MSWHDTNHLLIKEHVGMFKAANNYDIYDLSSGELLLECREPKLGWLTKLLRFTDYKRMTPFDVHLTTADGELVAQVSRGFSLLRSKVAVCDGDGRGIGGFQQRLLSIGGKFAVVDEDDHEQCMLKGKWTGWDFRFMADDVELAHVTKKWSGIGKELFTSADNYVLEIGDAVAAGSDLRRLILSAVMCIDMVLKE
ncbi:MAG: phospholipid scramblase-related protein [Planctomycetota bacterium]|jgi:uncharacterized protein YxjI